MEGSQYQQGVDEGVYLINLIKHCAALIETGNFTDADIALYNLSNLASPNGSTLQRVATYVIEALASCQVAKNLRGVPKIIRLSETLSTPEEQSVRQLFFDHFPLLRIAYTTTNETIIEAMKGETSIHVLDLSPSDSFQWIWLMHGLKESLSNTPCLKVTVTAIHEKKEVLEQMRLHLRVEAQKLHISFHFNAVEGSLESLDPERLPIKKGEPLAISCVLQLHSLLAIDDNMMVKMGDQRCFAKMFIEQNKMNPSPDSALSPFSPCPSHKMECFLSGLWRLQPKVMVITEQESNANGPKLTVRTKKALKFYGALFDCLEASISRTLVRRSILEKMLLGKEIKNIIACEGLDRKERHEKLKTWIPRLELAGFGSTSISSNGIRQAKKLLQSYVPGYRIHQGQENKFLFICWNKIPLFSVSAWKF